MDHRYSLAFEGSNYTSFDAYVGKYIKHYILPLHLGDYVFAKISATVENGSNVVFVTDAGTVVYEQSKMPDAYKAF
jgi:hypothetical protein